MPSLTLQAPLDGWCAPLSEVPDAVFADGMIGDGMAIDPTSGTVLAPCDGEVITLPAGGHAVSIRAAPGVDVLVHVGIDSVKLNGRGFRAAGERRAARARGDPLIRFDLDVVARGSKSLMTPIVLATEGTARIRRRHAPGRIVAGEMLMDIDYAAAAAEFVPTVRAASDARRTASSPNLSGAGGRAAGARQVVRPVQVVRLVQLMRRCSGRPVRLVRLVPMRGAGAADAVACGRTARRREPHDFAGTQARPACAAGRAARKAGAGRGCAGHAERAQQERRCSQRHRHDGAGCGAWRRGDDQRPRRQRAGGSSKR